MLAMKLLTAAAGISSAIGHDAPADARCGAPELVLNGVVEFLIIPYNYCLNENEANMALNNFQKMKKTQKLVKEVMSSAYDNFKWNIQGKWVLPKGDTTCALPSDFDEAFETEDYPAGGSITFTVVFNLVLFEEYEDANVDALNTQLNKELVNNDASSTYTICALSQEECDKIKVFEAAGTGGYYGMFVLNGENGPNSFELIPTDTSIISTLGCNPNYINAIPYESLNASTGDMTCECICPFGFKWKKLAMNKKYECVAIDQPLVLHPCSNAQHDSCHEFATSGNLDMLSPTCSLNNYLRTAALPVPFDNYVWATANEENGDAMVKFKFIDANGQSTLFEETWWDVHTDWEGILDKVGLFESVGLYQLIITAHDYEQSETCTTDILITDDISTVTTEKCPDPVVDAGGNPPAWNEDNFRSILQVFQDYVKNIQSRFEDTCTSGEECDVIDPGFKEWDKSEFLDVGQELLDWDQAFILSSDNQVTLKAIHDNIESGVPGSPKTKCWRVARHYGRESEQFICLNLDEQDANVKTCLRGAECNFIQCATYTGTTFFNTISSITQDIQDRTLNVTTQLGLEDFADEDKIIYEIVDATVVGEGPEGVKMYDLSNVFVIARTHTDFSTGPLVKFNDITPEESVACRYQLDGGDWKEFRFGKTNEVIFSKSETIVNLECWSSIGLIHEKEYNVRLFPHASLEYVCNAFQDEVFSPSLIDTRASTTSTFCNVKDSPFAEVLFHFDHRLGREIMVGDAADYDFMGMQCFAQLVYEDGDEFRNISTNEAALWTDATDLSLASKGDCRHRLGIDLITQPTRKNTMVRFRCVLDYKSTNGKEDMVGCNHVVTFHDCDAPLFPEDQETDVFEKCRQDCDDKVEPRGYCGGNYLYSTVTNMDRTIFYEANPQLECCAECGNEDDFQCLPLAHTSVYPDADDTLKQCSQPGGYHHQYTNVLMAQTLTEPIFAVAFIALAVLIISMVARRPEVIADQSAYIPLL